MVAITLPDGSVRDFAEPVSGAALAADIGPGLAKAALAIQLNGELRDLKTMIAVDSNVAIVTAKDDGALELLRHDAAHVMAEHDLAETAAQLGTLLEQLGKQLAQDDALMLSGNPDLEQLAASLDADRSGFRTRLMHQATAGHITAEALDRSLDAYRWLRRLAYHSWRIAFYQAPPPRT